jgi:hypothetical protein
MDLPTQLLPKRLGHRGGADYDRTVHFLTVGPGVSPAMLVDPDFWQHLADRLKVNDRLEIVSPEFDMDLRVVAVDPRRLWAQVRVLRFCLSEGVPIPGLAPDQYMESAVVAGAPDEAGYIVEWGGPRHLWRIVRGSDLIAKGFSKKDEAHARLAEIKSERAAA